MTIHRILKGFAPLAALAGAALLAGCDGMNIKIGDSEGVPLAELHLAMCLERRGPAGPSPDDHAWCSAIEAVLSPFYAYCLGCLNSAW